MRKLRYRRQELRVRLREILKSQCPSVFTVQSHYIEDFSKKWPAEAIPGHGLPPFFLPMRPPSSYCFPLQRLRVHALSPRQQPHIDARAAAATSCPHPQRHSCCTSANEYLAGAKGPSRRRSGGSLAGWVARGHGERPPSPRRNARMVGLHGPHFLLARGLAVVDAAAL